MESEDVNGSRGEGHGCETEEECRVMVEREKEQYEWIERKERNVTGETERERRGNKKRDRKLEVEVIWARCVEWFHFKLNWLKYCNTYLNPISEISQNDYPYRMGTYFIICFLYFKITSIAVGLCE